MTAIDSSLCIATNSYDTALCVIPPQQDCRAIDNLRALYDKSYGKWPPHMNVVYPFVAPELLSRAKSQIETGLHSHPMAKQQVTLDQAGSFKHTNKNDIFLCRASYDSSNILLELRAAALRALGQDVTPSNPYLTIGQSEDETDASSDFLLRKARLIPAMTFTPYQLVVLIREQTSSRGETASRMRFWGSIDVFNSPLPSPLLEHSWLDDPKEKVAQPELAEDESGKPSPPLFTRQVQPGTTYQYDTKNEIWVVADLVPGDWHLPTTLNVSSYNILIDSEYPPARDRDDLLISTILSDSALADVLVLQEVSDDFLSYLLADEEIREQYHFTSHGPPSQANIGPLPSLRNVVILSKWHFDWAFLPFHRRHKGATIASIFSSAQNRAHGPSFVVAGVHLTCGLTDGSVAAKKQQLQSVTSHLNKEFSNHPWIIAGDFNVTTSSYTIDEAVKSKSIAPQTVRTLESMELMLSEAGLLDAWAVARVEGTASSVTLEANDLFEGEEGATFNPRENALAAATSGTSSNRPQRYDRILVRPQGLLSIQRFNDFGMPETVSGISQVPSDHSGIRACLKVQDTTSTSMLESSDMLSQHPVLHKHAFPALSRHGNIAETFRQYSVFPTAEEEDRRKHAFALIREVVLGLPNNGSSSTSDVPMILVPVGSYALGVWTTESDIDCLCIGSISSKTFFQLARQRIHRAESRGVRLLRKVEASTVTMLELSVNGINMDLQYCPAASVAERWLEFPTLHPSDPIFNLSILSLRKLKPIRDLAYIKRTLPSIVSFRLAYHFIKLWATGRGIYSGKFGFLSGTHITLMLTWICKRLAHNTGCIAADDLVISFFHHYANFDWQTDTVFDAFFHKKKPRYQRSAREPMVILGYYAPTSNIAHTATTPGLQVVVAELRRASELLSTSGMTWATFFEKNDSVPLAVGAKHFLCAHESYVKIDIQYWGRALAKGKGLVGWVESRCINLVVDIHKTLPHLSVRIWPARFADKEADSTDSYYHGCYLIGLFRNEDVVDIEYRGQAKQSIQERSDRFLAQVQTDEKHYDAESCWIGVSLAKQSDVKGLILDDREWGDYIADTEVDEDKDENDEEPKDFANDVPSHSSRKLPIRASTPSSSMPVSSSKLRPASDILNRLRWDPNLDPSEYIVGYEDRFLGAKETSLERWKTEQTDEEFIPQHRILYFKKRFDEDGKGCGSKAHVVWERATRIDRIFGSGIGDGGGGEKAE